MKILNNLIKIRSKKIIKSKKITINKNRKRKLILKNNKEINRKDKCKNK